MTLETIVADNMPGLLNVSFVNGCFYDWAIDPSETEFAFLSEGGMTLQYYHQSEDKVLEVRHTSAQTGPDQSTVKMYVAPTQRDLTTPLEGISNIIDLQEIRPIADQILSGFMQDRKKVLRCSALLANPFPEFGEIEFGVNTNPFLVTHSDTVGQPVWMSFRIDVDTGVAAVCIHNAFTGQLTYMGSLYIPPAVGLSAVGCIIFAIAGHKFIKLAIAVAAAIAFAYFQVWPAVITCSLAALFFVIDMIAEHSAKGATPVWNAQFVALQKKITLARARRETALSNNEFDAEYQALFEIMQYFKQMKALIDHPQSGLSPKEKSDLKEAIDDLTGMVEEAMNEWTDPPITTPVEPLPGF